MAAKNQKNNQQMLRDYQTTITILEHLSDAIFILNGAGNIEYANKTALDILRIRFAEITGKSFVSFLDPEFFESSKDQEAIKINFIDKITTGNLQNFEVDLVFKDYITPVVLSFGVVRQTDDQVAYIIVSAKDITVRRDLERKLSQQQMITIAKDRHRELGEMAVSLVHELSQPLTSLRLTMELTQKQNPNSDEPNDKLNKNLAKMLELISGMDKSISNVRSFASQTEDESMKAISLVNSVNEAKDLISYELKNKNIQIELTEQPGLPEVLANPINVQQVFVTLIRSFWENFDRYDIKGIEKEKWLKKISIELYNVEDKWILIKLEDNINIEDQPDLFLKDTIKKSVSSGMNLHLSTAKLIVHSIGGDLRSQMLPTGGLRYKIRIPVDQKEERDELYNLIEMLQD